MNDLSKPTATESQTTSYRIVGDVLTAFGVDITLPTNCDFSDEQIRRTIAQEIGIRKFMIDTDFRIDSIVKLDEHGNEIDLTPTDDNESCEPIIIQRPTDNGTPIDRARVALEAYYLALHGTSLYPAEHAVIQGAITDLSCDLLRLSALHSENANSDITPEDIRDFAYESFCGRRDSDAP